MTFNVQRLVPQTTRPGRFAALAFLTSAAVIAATVTFAGSPARADSDIGDGFVASEDVVDALENIQGDLVKTPLATESTLPGLEASGSDADVTLEIEIPGAATEGVTMSVGGFSLGIGLPHADEATPGEPLADGSTVYPSGGSSANAVIPTSNSVQLLSVIDGEDASATYAYDLSLPAGHRLEASQDGGARIVDEQNTVWVEFEPAWARDAAGKEVPTRYSVDGNTLTQIVDHKGLDTVTYPVVADPLPVIVFVVTAAAAIVVVALALGVATWIVVSWWNTCRAQNKYPELSTRNGFSARCVR